MDICQNRPKSKSNIVQIIESKSNIFGIDPALVSTNHFLPISKLTRINVYNWLITSIKLCTIFQKFRVVLEHLENKKPIHQIHNYHYFCLIFLFYHHIFIKKDQKKPKFTFKPTLNCPKKVRILMSFECNLDLIWIQNQPKLKSH